MPRWMRSAPTWGAGERHPVLAAFAALLLAASLIFETAFRSDLAAGRVLAFAGLAFLAAAVIAPYRPRPPEAHVSLYEHIPHPHLKHRTETGPVKVADQLDRGNWYKRVNAKVAVWITVGVGSMTCAWLFAILAFAGLPTALKPGNIGFLFWFSSDLLQLTLLSVIIVGQNLQAGASDKRAEQTYLDAEAVLAEAIKIQEHLQVQDAVLERLIAEAAPVKRLATPAERHEGSQM